MSVTTLVALLSAATSTAGLVFVGRSVRLLTLQIRSQSHQAIYEHQHEVDALMFGRLDLKAIVDGRRPLPPVADPLYDDVMAAVELHMTMYEHVWTSAAKMSPDVAAHQQAYMRGMADGDAFRAYMQSVPADWFHPEFVTYLGVATQRGELEGAHRATTLDP